MGSTFLRGAAQDVLLVVTTARGEDVPNVAGLRSPEPLFKQGLRLSLL